MKKTLLILAIAAGSALQATAQSHIVLNNSGFETGTVGDTNSQISGWKTNGMVKLVSSATFNMTDGTQQTQIPVDGSTKFLEIRPKKVTDTTYQRGIIRQSVKISSGTIARPTYFQFQGIYVPGSGSERLFIRVALTKFNFTTALSDTIGSVAILTNPGGQLYPWGKLGLTITYRNNETPDSAHVEFWANAAQFIGPNTALFLDDLRFENRIVTGVQFLDKTLAGIPAVYPNPMTSKATISYTLSQNSPVNINVYDISGRLVRTVFTGNLPKGEHKAILDRGNLNAGMYIYKLQAGSQAETGKIIIAD